MSQSERGVLDRVLSEWHVITTSSPVGGSPFSVCVANVVARTIDHAPLRPTARLLAKSGLDRAAALVTSTVAGSDP